MQEIKLFGKWSNSGIKVNDPGLKSYISLKTVLVPETGARDASERFYKSKRNIVERLIGKVMVPGHKSKKHKYSSGHVTGKKQQAMKIVEDAFQIIENKMKKNPVEVFVKALENAAPRDEVTSIEYGGARYPQAVDCAPQRRIDQAIKQMVQGSFGKSFNNKRKIQECLADEIMKASELSQESNAISKKLEAERQADSSR